MFLFVVYNLLPSIWITLLQRQRLLQACQGTGWGKGRDRAKERGMQVAMGTKTLLPWAEESMGEIRQPNPIKSTKGVSPGQKLAPCFSLSLPCCCSLTSATSSQVEFKSSSPNWVPQDTAHPKSPGSDGWQTDSNLRQHASVVLLKRHMVSLVKASWMPQVKAEVCPERQHTVSHANHPALPMLLLPWHKS